jgi:hypothetical protein
MDCDPAQKFGNTGVGGSSHSTMREMRIGAALNEHGIGNALKTLDAASGFGLP